MRKKSKAVRKLEQELIFYLQLYRELRNRELVSNTLSCIEFEINELVEKLKQM